MIPDREFFTAPDLARIFKLTPARVYRLAHDHLWRRRRIAGRTCYWLHDAQDTLTTTERDKASSAE